jgi:hypothetical protein
VATPLRAKKINVSDSNQKRLYLNLIAVSGEIFGKALVLAGPPLARQPLSQFGRGESRQRRGEG